MNHNFMHVTALLLLGLSFFSFASENPWNGLYTQDGEEREKGPTWEMELSGCDDAKCAFIYRSNGHHACGYEGVMEISGRKAIHVYEDVIGEPRRCEMEFRFRQSETDRFISIESSTRDCEVIGACGAMAGIGGSFVKVRPRASFECAKARSNIEKIICSNRELAHQDKEINALYKRVLALWPACKEAIEREQRSWLLQRNSCLDNSDSDCVKDRQQERIAHLQEVVIYAGVLASVAEDGEASWADRIGLTEFIHSLTKSGEMDKKFVEVTDFNHLVFARFLARFSDPYIVDRLSEPGMWCDSTAAKIEQGYLLLTRETCPDRGQDTVVISLDGLDIWVLKRESAALSILSGGGRTLETAPVEVQEWIKKAGEGREVPIKYGKSTWLSPDNFGKELVWADKTQHEWGHLYPPLNIEESCSADAGAKKKSTL